ncbi:hypothetical protein [Aquamicrobium terrae]
MQGKPDEEAYLHHVAFKAKQPEDVDAFAAHLRGIGVEVRRYRPAPRRDRVRRSASSCRPPVIRSKV